MFFRTSDAAQDDNGYFFPDATSAFQPLKTASNAQYKLANKESISAHRTINNDALSVSIWISRYPVQFYNDNLIGYENLQDRPRLALELLNKWFRSGVELIFFDEYDVYDNFVITSLSPVTEGSGDALRFDLTLQKVQRTTSKNSIIYMSEELKLNAKSNDTIKAQKKPVSPEQASWIEGFAQQ